MVLRPSMVTSASGTSQRSQTRRACLHGASTFSGDLSKCYVAKATNKTFMCFMVIRPSKVTPASGTLKGHRHDRLGFTCFALQRLQPPDKPMEAFFMRKRLLTVSMLLCIYSLVTVYSSGAFTRVAWWSSLLALLSNSQSQPCFVSQWCASLMSSCG